MNRNRSKLTSVLMVMDVLLVVLAFYAGIGARDFFPLSLRSEVFVVQEHTWLMPVSLILYLIFAHSQHVYAPLRLIPDGRLLRRFFTIYALDLATLTAVIFFLKAQETSRAFVFSFLTFKFFFLSGSRLLYKTLSRTFRPRKYNDRRFLVITEAEHRETVSRALQGDPLMRIQVMDSLTPEEATREKLGIVLLKAVDDCLVSCNLSRLPELQPLISFLEERGIVVHFDLRAIGLDHSRINLDRMADVPVLSSQAPVLTLEAVLTKRTFDLLFAFLGCGVTAALFPFIALAIKLDSKGPILFRQWRIGQNGRRFKCYKFRSMVMEAEELKRQLADQNEMTGPIFKVSRDPRVTRVGAFLRKTSLDELPQFVNVLRGEMSLIGTRPPTPDEVERYTNKAFRRISIKPGLTGLWQVSGRSQVREFHDILRLDLEYIDSWSVWMDIKILFRTVWILVLGKGAT